MIATRGITEPAMKAIREARAAAQGETCSSASRLRKTWAWASRAACSLSSLATCSDRSGERPALGVVAGELLQLALGVGVELGLLLADRGQFAVPLAADGDVLAAGHRQGAGHHAGEAGDQQRHRIGGGAGDAEHEAGGGDDAVVGTEHAGAQPVQSLRQRLRGCRCRDAQSDRHESRFDGISPCRKQGEACLSGLREAAGRRFLHNSS